MKFYPYNYRSAISNNHLQPRQSIKKKKKRKRHVNLSSTWFLVAGSQPPLFLCQTLSEMAALKATTSFVHLKNPHAHCLPRLPCHKSTLSLKRFTPMAALTASPTVGLAETFTRLKKQGKVSSFISFLMFFSFLFLKESILVLWCCVDVIWGTLTS